MTKILYFDTETTGLDPLRNEMVQFAAIVEIDGVVKEQVNWRCQPKNWDCVSQQALDITGITIEDLKKLPTPEKMYSDILGLFNRYVSKYDRAAQKFYPAGHNVVFDLQFLDKFFKRYGGSEVQEWGISSWQNWRALDSRIMANFLLVNGSLDETRVPNVKLKTMADYWDIEINAHDALSDIKATREVIKKMMVYIK